MRDGETELESEIWGRLRRDDGSKRLLHGAQGIKFARAAGAGFQVLSDLLHPLSADGAVEVGRERRLALLTGLGDHRVTNSLDVSSGEYDAAFVEGIRLSILSSARMAERPPVSRDLTVRRFTLRISAISSLAKPSISPWMTTVWKDSGS